MTHGKIRLFTIGFAGSTAEHFFARLRTAGVQKVIDTRLWPDTQLSGFARKKDLPFLLHQLANISYEHRADLAPSEDILRDYKNKAIAWTEYDVRYRNLLTQRRITEIVKPNDVADACFLCAEKEPHYCHRRLLAEHLASAWGDTLTVVHL